VSKQDLIQAGMLVLGFGLGVATWWVLYFIPDLWRKLRRK
jgi:hypothetical protein